MSYLSEVTATAVCIGPSMRIELMDCNIGMDMQICIILSQCCCLCLCLAMLLNLTASLTVVNTDFSVLDCHIGVAVSN